MVHISSQSTEIRWERGLWDKERMWFDAYSVGLLNKLRKIIFFVVAKSEKKNIALFSSELGILPGSLLNRAIFLTFRRI